MSRRTIWLIVLAALVLHAGLFFYLSRVRALPKSPYVPPPNFGYAEETYHDAQTGEKLVYREIRVSTHLADPAQLKQLEAQRASPAPSPKPTSAPDSPRLP